VTSIECLSSLEKYIPNSELNRDRKSAERYVRFIQDFCAEPQKFYGPEGEQGFIQNLKTVYYIHRSAFVHAGKEVPIAAASTADELGVPSVKHYVDGKEVSTPGLVWFAQIVQRSLVGFLKQFPKNAEADRDYVQEIAAGRWIISLPMAGDTPVG
jgi:hypothetical protein